MENLKLYCLIYELKGMVKSMSELIETDDQYNNPIVEPIENKMREIIQEIEKESA